MRQSVQKCKQASSLKSDNNLKPIYSVLSSHNPRICFRNLYPGCSRFERTSRPLALSGVNGAKISVLALYSSAGSSSEYRLWRPGVLAASDSFLQMTELRTEITQSLGFFFFFRFVRTWKGENRPSRATRARQRHSPMSCSRRRNRVTTSK